MGKLMVSGLRPTAPGGVLEALLGVEDDLADAHGVGGDLDALVVGGEFEGLLQGKAARRHEPLENVGRGGAHIRLLLLVADRKSVV